jgi:hypothetical protein
MTTWPAPRASGERVSHGSPSTRANLSSAMFLPLPAGNVRNGSGAGGTGTPILHCANQARNCFGNNNLCPRLRDRPHRRQHCHGEAEMSLRSSGKSHIVQAGTRGNATTVGDSPGRNLFCNNDEHGRPLTSGWQLDARNKNGCRFTDDREIGMSRNCRLG